MQYVHVLHRRQEVRDVVTSAHRIGTQRKRVQNELKALNDSNWCREGKGRSQCYL